MDDHLQHAIEDARDALASASFEPSEIPSSPIELAHMLLGFAYGLLSPRSPNSPTAGTADAVSAAFAAAKAAGLFVSRAAALLDALPDAPAAMAHG
jgi:hypothetical protein